MSFHGVTSRLTFPVGLQPDRLASFDNQRWLETVAEEKESIRVKNRFEVNLFPYLTLPIGKVFKEFKINSKKKFFIFSFYNLYDNSNNMFAKQIKDFYKKETIRL